MKTHEVTISKIKGNKNNIYNLLIDGNIVCQIDAKGNGVNRYMKSSVKDIDVLRFRANKNAKNVLDQKYGVNDGDGTHYLINLNI